MSAERNIKPPTEAINRAFSKMAVAGGTPTKPAMVVVQTEDGVTWLALRDYGARQAGLKIGTGAFLTFQSMNDAGEWGDWAMINSGLIDRTKGREQGDHDFLWVIDGKIAGIAGVGNMTGTPGGSPAAVVPINDRQLNIGSPVLRFVDLFLGGLLDVETVGVQIELPPGSGNWVWRDCIPVRTQQGVRFVETHACSPTTMPPGMK